jgi:hypothetical protein
MPRASAVPGSTLPPVAVHACVGLARHGADSRRKRVLDASQDERTADRKIWPRPWTDHGPCVLRQWRVAMHQKRLGIEFNLARGRAESPRYSICVDDGVLGVVGLKGHPARRTELRAVPPA